MTPLFLPTGVFTNEVLDPAEFARDAQEAAKVAGATGPWQWLRSAFTDVNKLVRGGPVIREAVGVTALLGTLPGTAPVLPDDAAANANLWKIPYNRGFSAIDSDGAAGGAMRLTWTAQYPELLWCLYSLQYIRRDTTLGASTWTAFWTTGRIPRVQLRMQVDGAPLDGTGPDVAPIDAKYRGRGLAVKAAAPGVSAITIVPPGFHTWELTAAQASAMNSDEDTGEAETYGDGGPTEGVCIGTRRGVVLRFPLGVPLGA